MDLGLLQHAVAVNGQPDRDCLFVIPRYLMVLDGFFLSTPAMLCRTGRGQMPFDIGGTGDQGDVVQVDNLGRGNQPLPIILVSLGFVPSGAGRTLAIDILSHKLTHWKQIKETVTTYPPVLRHCSSLRLANFGIIHAKQHRSSRSHEETHQMLAFCRRLLAQFVTACIRDI